MRKKLLIGIGTFVIVLTAFISNSLTDQAENMLLLQNIEALATTNEAGKPDCATNCRMEACGTMWIGDTPFYTAYCEK